MRILQISTHTTLVPSHGGQIRSNRIAANVERAGHVVRRLAVGYRPADHVDDAREPHIDISKSRYCTSSQQDRDFGVNWRHLVDYGTMFAVRECPDTRKRVFEEIAAAAPQIIMLEHPWLWPIVDAYCAETGKKIPVIYNSQNVEGQLKRKIAVNEGRDVPEAVLSAIEALERDCVMNAVATTTCTDADRDAFVALGGKWVVTAPNGTDRPHRDHLLNVLPAAIPARVAYALFVGSAHPPNISGFLNLMAPSLPRLHSNQRFVVVGGAGVSIAKELKASGREALTEGRLVTLGTVTKQVLEAVIANANVVVLPIQYGGGSNVKTAEAFLSGRRMVASHHALRGFQGMEASSNLRIAEDQSFGAAVLEELAKPFRIKYDDLPDHYLWENTTKPILDVISKTLVT
jgi:hypothetical protein